MVFTRSFKLALIATVICLLMGYPMACFLAREGAGFQRVAMMLIMLPMWMNFLLRTYAWMSILENNGLLNQFFDAIGLFDLINGLFGTEIEYFNMINTQGAVVLGMVYNFLPFMILPIYSVIVKLDHRADRGGPGPGGQLGHGVPPGDPAPVPARGALGHHHGVRPVRCPPSPSPACWAAASMLLLGDLIEMQFLGSAYNPHLGSAIALVMMVIVLVCMAIMNRFGEGEEQAVML